MSGTDSLKEASKQVDLNKRVLCDNMYLPVASTKVVRPKIGRHLVKKHTDSDESVESNVSMTGLKNIEPRKYPKRHDCKSRESSLSSSRGTSAVNNTRESLQRYKPRTTIRNSLESNHNSQTSLKSVGSLHTSSQSKFLRPKNTKSQLAVDQTK
jgi:hypothetical protein